MSSGLCGLNTKAETVGSTEKRHPVLNGIKILSRDPRESIGKSVLLFPFFFMLFSGLHIMIVKRKRMENRKYLVARSPFVK